jgi:glutathione S-transferase
MTTITLTPEHGYAFATLIGTAITIVGLGGQVGGYRKKAKIPYPYMYATKEQADKDQAAHLFNCAQRVHQNTLENYPTFLVVYSVAAIKYPLIASVCGIIYFMGRVGFSRGYMTGKPEKRHYGAFGYIGLFALLGTAITTCYTLITA